MGVKPLLEGCLLGEAPVAEDLGSEFVRQARDASENLEAFEDPFLRLFYVVEVVAQTLVARLEDIALSGTIKGARGGEVEIRRRRPPAGDQPPEAEGSFLLSTAERQPGTFASHAGDELLDSLERLSIPRRFVELLAYQVLRRLIEILEASVSDSEKDTEDSEERVDETESIMCDRLKPER